MEYYKLEQRDMLNPEQTRTVYRLKNESRIDGTQFIREVAHRHSYNEAVVTGVLIDVAKELAEQLGKGHSVELPNIGVFSIGVRMKGDAEQDAKPGNEAGVAAADTDAADPEPNARSLRLDHINFSKNKDFFGQVEACFSKQSLRRVYGREGVRIKTSKYPQVKNRMIVAREFLADHPFMTVSDYANITGLSYSTAQRELKQAWQNPDYGITVKGSGSHRVYVLMKD